MLLTADIPYMIGLLLNSFKKVKFMLSSMVTIFDVDSGEIYRNKRFFLQATESEVFFSPDIFEKKKENYEEIPDSLFAPKIKEFESKIKESQKPKSESKMRAYSQKLRDFFFSFFMIDLLDYKNWNYSHEDLFLSHSRRKKLSKEHYEFIKNFASTQTFKQFQSQYLTKKTLSQNERKVIDYIDSFIKNLRVNDVEDNRECKNINNTIKKCTFNNLLDNYYNHSDLLPIK